MNRIAKLIGLARVLASGEAFFFGEDRRQVHFFIADFLAQGGEQNQRADDGNNDRAKDSRAG
jgi:hypothetical protein